MKWLAIITDVKVQTYKTSKQLTDSPGEQCPLNHEESEVTKQLSDQVAKMLDQDQKDP